MPELLKDEKTAKLSKPDTKKLSDSETKKLTKSQTRAKKDKAQYNVKDAENSLLLKLKDGDVVIEMYPEEQMHYDIADAVDEIIMVAAKK